MCHIAIEKTSEGIVAAPSIATYSSVCLTNWMIFNDSDPPPQSSSLLIAESNW